MKQLFIAVAITIALGSTAQAQYTLRMTSDTGFPGDDVTVTAELDIAGGATPIRGWSFGVCVPSSDLSVLSAASGATTLTVNGGNPPDFESLDVFATGITHGVVICFSGCADLGAGVGYELADVTCDLAGPIGAIGDLCFCDTLGSPPVETVVVDNTAAATVPAQLCGSIEIVEPLLPPTGATCAITPLLCTCDVSFSWTNASTYDSINVYRDGTLVATLGGGATSYSDNVPEGSYTYCVEGVRAGVATAQVCCVADCSGVVPPADPVTGLGCSVDTSNCTTDVTWTIPASTNYSEIRLFIDGVLDQTLPGGATSALGVVLPAGVGPFVICVEATTVCGEITPQTCCTVTCAQEFQRGDVNVDASVNLADPVQILEVLFAGGSITCDKAADVNDDGGVDIADAVFALDYLFNGGANPAAPFGVCGTDPTADSLTCASYSLCP